MEYYLIYVSTADHLMSESELCLILEQSKKWNEDHGITGMLIYIEGQFARINSRSIDSSLCGRFMQILEGSKIEVERIFNIISADLRHHDLIVLKRADESVRNFESWTMGFRSFTLDEYCGMNGYINLDDSYLSSAELQSSNIPLLFLKSFYQRGKQASPFINSVASRQQIG
jgi:hypothetical protein